MHAALTLLLSPSTLLARSLVGHWRRTGLAATAAASTAVAVSAFSTPKKNRPLEVSGRHEQGRTAAASTAAARVPDASRKCEQLFAM